MKRMDERTENKKRQSSRPSHEISCAICGRNDDRSGRRFFLFSRTFFGPILRTRYAEAVPTSFLDFFRSTRRGSHRAAELSTASKATQPTLNQPQKLNFTDDPRRSSLQRSTHTHTQARATIKEANKQTSTQSWLQMEPPGRLDGWRRRKASAIVGSDSPTRPPLIRRPPPFFLSTPSDRIRHPTNISFGTCFARVEQTEILELAIGIGNNRQSISHSSSPPFRSTPFSMSQ